MKKTLAILLSLALLITAIPFATAMANTYDTAAAFYETETWATSQKKPTVTATQVQIAAPAYQHMIAILTLKPNTTYHFSVDYSPTWYKTKLYSGNYGFSVYENGKGVADSLLTSNEHGTDGSAGSIRATFTTTDATEYCFRIGFDACQCPDHSADPHYQSNYNFKNFSLEAESALEKASTAIATKFTGTQYASIRAKDEDAGKAQGLRVRSDIDTSVLGDAALEDCTVVEYGTLVAKTENLGGAAMTIDMVGTEKKVVKGVAYNTFGTDVVYKLDGTTKSFTLVLINIPVERFVTSYSYRAYAIIEDAEGNQATVYGGATVPVSVESVATDIVKSGTATTEDKAAAQTALDEYAAYEETLTPVYTTSADLYNLDNWTASNGNQYLSTDGSTYVEHTWLVNNTDTIAMTLKPNTTYKFSCDIGGTSDCNVTNEKYSNIKKVEVFASGNTSTALATTGDIVVWVYSWYAKTFTLTFTTDATGECFVRVTGQNDLNARGLVYKNLSITEVAE